MLRFAVIVVVLAVIFAGCKIQESDQGISGSAYVTLRDTAGTSIERASVWVDGHETSQRTPALLSGLTVGTHVIAAIRPDTYETSDTVEVVFNDTVAVSLSTTYRPLGPIELVSAPDNAELILDFLSSGNTPPTVFFVGIGTHRASAYLPGHATNLPAIWTVDVVQNDTARIPVVFTPIESGGQVDQLAPSWALASDFDSMIFRLQDYRGQVLLLTFFYVDCAPCIAEMPAIQSVYSDASYAGQIQFFGIDPNDNYYTFSQFRNIYHPELGLTFPLVHDMGQVVRGAYGVEQFPTNFIVDRTGKIRYRLGGITANILRDAIDVLLAEAP